MPRALACTVLLFGCLAVPAGAAASDSWTAPSTLFYNTSATENTSTYGVDSFEPTGAQGDCRARGKTAWWRIAGNGQAITLSTAEPGTNFDTVLAVYTGVPPDQVLLTCNDNHPGDALDRSRLTFTSLRGTSYLVQVGGVNNCGPSLGPCPQFGTVVLRATTAGGPVNDNRAAATTLATGATAESDNTGAGQEPGEDATCDGAPFAATVWHRWSAPAVGDATFSASAAFGNTVLAVYRADSGARIGCNDDAPGQVAGSSRLVLRVSPGNYLVQVGAQGADGPVTGQGRIVTGVTFVEDRDADNDGASLPEDCNDADPAIRPGVVDPPEDGVDQDCAAGDAINFDRDRDGFTRPGDCNDANAQIHAGARDIPGNKVDEDCDLRDAAYPRLASTVRSFFAYPPLRFTSLTIVRAVAGSRVELRCRGGGCFKRPKVITVRKSAPLFSIRRYVRTLRPKRGAVIEIRITKKNNVGFMRRVTARGGRSSPKISDYCLPVGGGKPTRC